MNRSRLCFHPRFGAGWCCPLPRCISTADPPTQNTQRLHATPCGMSPDAFRPQSTAGRPTPHPGFSQEMSVKCVHLVFVVCAPRVRGVCTSCSWCVHLVLVVGRAARPAAAAADAEPSRGAAPSRPPSFVCWLCAHCVFSLSPVMSPTESLCVRSQSAARYFGRQSEAKVSPRGAADLAPQRRQVNKLALNIIRD